MDMGVDEMNSSTEDTPAVDDAMASAGISSAITSSSEASTANSSASSHEHSHESHGAEQAPDPHSHGAHNAALEMLNDTEIHRWHHFPPTYLDADFRLDADSAIFGEEFDESWDLEDVESHKGLAFVHAFLMGLAYFGVLPIALALRAADHPAHYLASIASLAIAVLGWLAGAAYSAATPNYYEGAIYPKFVNILLLTSICFTVFDSLELIKRGIAFYRRHDRTWKGFYSDVLRSPGSITDEKWSAARYEMVGLTDIDSDEEIGRDRDRDGHVMFAIGDDEDNEHRVAEPEHMDGTGGLHHSHESQGFDEREIARSLLKGSKPRRPSIVIRQFSSPSRTSTGSEGTLQDTPHSSSSSSHGFLHKASQLGAYDAHSSHREDSHDAMRARSDEQNNRIWRSAKAKGPLRVLEVVLTWVRRTQIIFAYVTMLAGIVTYTGMCRAGLINSCAAHYIKGSIFFWYGVLTFARYLGAYADLGWAWNRRPSRNSVSAEMVECAVIFTYGITNTWMERFGAAPGSPYTVKQVQHISIAVMFWFAGLSGMLLESRWVRRVLAAVMSTGRSSTKEPATYAFSFNPLPALTIGVTGLAMAAHHQTYVFQVQIHSLWGILLAGGSLFRCFTYIFLYASPPVHSALPSRPPTEILTSFGWAAGGIVFMLSNEEICWSAMRAGWDDMMAFLNFTVALTCFVFCWAVVIMAIKGWATMRIRREEERQEGVSV